MKLSKIKTIEILTFCFVFLSIQVLASDWTDKRIMTGNKGRIYARRSYAGVDSYKGKNRKKIKEVIEKKKDEMSFS